MTHSITLQVRPDETARHRLDKFLLRELTRLQEESDGTPAAADDCPQPTCEVAEEPAEELPLDDACSADAKPLFISREAIKKAVAAGLCTLNGSVVTSPSARLKAGDTVMLSLPETGATLAPEDGPVCVIWQDRDILVVNKPAGLTVHPCPSCPQNTLVQRLAFRFPEIAAMGGLRPGIVHRLDKETSGLLLVARNERARLALVASFARRLVKKRYLAIVAGTPPKTGECREAIGRDPQHRIRMACVPEQKGGREAYSEYETLWSAPDGHASLVAVRIHTGRTHQIRVHMAHLGHPLLGDALYAPAPVAALAPRVMLHAASLTFPHPTDGTSKSFAVAPPQDFQDCLTEQAFASIPLVITGNPGSGKSLVLSLLAREGIPVISADELVKGYYNRGGEAAQWLARVRGEDMLLADGSVDRKKLMQAFEEAPDFRRQVEELCHSLVLGDIRSFFAWAQKEKKPLAAAEIPLYFECGWHKGAFVPKPLTVGVATPLSLREGRLMRTRSWSGEKIAAIEQWQWNEERKLAACDLSVANTGTREDLVWRVKEELLPALARVREERTKRLCSLFATFWGTGPGATSGMAPGEAGRDGGRS